MAAQPEYLSLLQESELFAGVPAALVGDVLPEFEKIVLARSDVLFREGDVGDAVYVVVSGELDLEVDGLRFLRRATGECVGEFALIDDEPRSATAVARDDVTLLRWSRAAFQETLHRDVDIARGIFRMLTGKLRQDLERTVDMQLEKERWRQDLARAREIQAGMLPESEGSVGGLEIAGYCTPAAEVGGDFYDYLDFGQSGVGFIVCDVTGHGFYSGLFVAMVKSCVHTQARIDVSPAMMMAALRRTLALSIQRRLLMTGFYGIANRDERTLRYSNAGHPYPYVFRAASAQIDRLEALDPLLGVLDVDEVPFSERCVEWHPGDLMVLYSDGVTETRSPLGEMYGHDRLERCIRDGARLGARGLRDRILDEVSRHGKGRRSDDDLTLVVVQARE